MPERWSGFICEVVYFGGKMPWEKKLKLERRNRDGYQDPTAYEALIRISAKY